MVAKMEKEKIKERKMSEEQDEVLRNELRAREKNMPKDILDEDYFKDSKRFNIKEDKRDPLFAGLKDEEGAGDWRSFLSQGMKESKEQFVKMKEAEPLSFSQASMSGGRFGYKTYKLEWLGGGLMLIVLVLIFFELRAEYLENVEEKKILNRGRG